MDSPQSVVSPLKISLSECEKQHAEKPSLLLQRKESGVGKLEELVGGVEVYIHQARDIHNICIYQKQDVYAKLCVTSDPEKTVSTKIINGGGANPIFNENLSLDVGKVDSSLKCEIWMLSRVRNYLEDQLLGFTLVPISEVLLHNGKLEKEFSLSSTDLFHSPAGFVQLSVSYIGSPPEVIPIPAPVETESVNSVPEDMDKLEFPDPKVVNENHQMVEEYFANSSDSLVSSDTENQVSSEVEVEVEVEIQVDSPPSSASTDGASKSPREELVSPPNDKDKSANADVTPVVTVNMEAEPKLVQQDIVDMYMKSMQQFTESLAKMKLPMDFENGPTSSENSTTSDQKTPGSKNTRVFYGSSAFF